MADNQNIVVVAVLGLLGLFAIPQFLKEAGDITDGTPRGEPIDDLDSKFVFWGERQGLDWRLVKAIAMAESSLIPTAKNPLDPSFGLMQVLCVNDGPNSPCRNRFNIVGWDEATPNTLLDPDFNLDLATQIMKWNLETFGYNKGISVYNNWSARNTPNGEDFPNQRYVDKVIRNHRANGGQPPNWRSS